MKKEIKYKRQLKIYTKHIPRLRKTIVVPEIRLSGKWLIQFGFTHGRSISVTCKENEIIITTTKDS